MSVNDYCIAVVNIFRAQLIDQDFADKLCGWPEMKPVLTENKAK